MDERVPSLNLPLKLISHWTLTIVELKFKHGIKKHIPNGKNEVRKEIQIRNPRPRQKVQTVLRMFMMKPGSKAGSNWVRVLVEGQVELCVAV